MAFLSQDSGCQDDRSTHKAAESLRAARFKSHQAARGNHIDLGLLADGSWCPISSGHQAQLRGISAVAIAGGSFSGDGGLVLGRWGSL